MLLAKNCQGALRQNARSIDDIIGIAACPQLWCGGVPSRAGAAWSRSPRSASPRSGGLLCCARGRLLRGGGVSAVGVVADVRGRTSVQAIPTPAGWKFRGGVAASGWLQQCHGSAPHRWRPTLVSTPRFDGRLTTHRSRQATSPHRAARPMAIQIHIAHVPPTMAPTLGGEPRGAPEVL